MEVVVSDTAPVELDLNKNIATPYFFDLLTELI
jgi:hypothetical protein